MVVPFKLKIGQEKFVEVEEVEIMYKRCTYANEVKYNTGITSVSYYIKNEDNKGRIYSGMSICSTKDNFNRRFGKRLAELRLINHYRRRNGMPDIKDAEEIAELEKDIRYTRSMLNNVNLKEKRNELTVDQLSSEMEAKEETLDSIWDKY